IQVDRDLTGLEITPRPGPIVQGRVVRAGGDKLPFALSAIRLHMEQRKGDGGTWVSGWDGDMTAEGVFSFEAPAGVSSLQISGLPATWSVKAIRVEGSDITDQPTDFGQGGRKEVEVVLTDRIASAVGRVSDRNGRMVPNYTVVVFPEDKTYWMPPSRRVRSVRPEQDGSFRIP